MKKMLALILTLCMLCGCVPAEPMKTPNEEILPVADTDTVVYPQTGAYQETALLANVPGQGWPQLLSVREDGTVDYIFSAEENLDAGGRLSSDGLQYYTITSTGSYARQETPWIEDLEEYLTRAWSDAGVPDAFWQYLFASKDGTIWILTQLEDPKVNVKEQMLCSALFKVENSVMTMIPVDWNVDTGSEVFAIDRQPIGGLQLEEDAILLELTWCIAAIDRYLTAVYAANGELVELREQKLYPIPQPDGSILFSTSPYGTTEFDEAVRSMTLDDDKTLYLLGSPWVWRRANAVTSDGILYTWLQYFDQGILMQYTPSPAGKIEPEVLTVWSLEEIDAIQAAICQWNHTHASPIFRYETAQNNEDLTRLNLELANGQGPDVLILDGLDVPAYLDFMAALDGLDTTGVYENLLEPFTVGGQLLAIPTRMNPWLLGRTATGTRKVESLSDFADLVTTSTGVLDLSADFGNAYRYHYALYNVTYAEDVFDQWYPVWQDAIFENGRFREDVFREFLTETKRLVEHYSLDTLTSSGLEERSFFTATDDSIFGNYAKRPFPYTLAATNYVGLHSYWWHIDPTKTQDPIPCTIDGIPGPDGTGITVPKHIAAVRAGGNEAAGQAFVKLLLDEKLQLGGQYYDNGIADGYPVKWTAIDRLITKKEAYLSQSFAVENDFNGTLEGLRAVLIADIPYEAALEAALGYYTGELTLDDAIAQAQKRAALYLAEQSR